MSFGPPRQLKKAARVILVGAPGVGKGTQTERLLDKFPQLASISSGDLLRENVRDKTQLGLKVESAIQSGNLVPDSTILDLISSEFKSRGWLLNNGSVSPTASFILDGFPRTAAQAASLDALIPVNFVVQLLTPPSVILSRIASRWIHEPSGRVYNTTFHAPKVPYKDDVTGEPLTQRKDDSIDTWKQRLQKFEDTSKTLLQHYDAKGVLWRVEGNTSDEITPKLFAEIEKRFC
ncbi:adenylate kinase [Aspergillus sclerotialis]|uniref:GTP:AMP phosphotransferase, mitochondrial n=1 Tax=Aspergillus sclerotialis TaxID=2070753 RepID=A0A3A2ZJA0_9EURO|nr:adenylate kinase [Aspergillus sclerotialis]